MAKKRNRITLAMSKTIAESSPLIKKTKLNSLNSSKGNITDIEIDLLIKNPFQPRININLHSLNELISSIEQNGLLQPILVTEKQKNGYHTIIAGHRRYEAHKIMNKSTIKTVIMENIGDKELAVLSLTENLMREDLHPIENAIAIKHILENKIVESQNKLAEYVGLSKGYVSKLMNILKLPSSVIKIIKNDNYKDVNILILLNKLETESKIIKIYEEIKNLTRNDADKYIKNILNDDDNDTKTNRSIVSYKKSKNKMNLNINTNEFTNEQLEVLNKKFNFFNTELEKLINGWT